MFHINIYRESIGNEIKNRSRKSKGETWESKGKERNKTHVTWKQKGVTHVEGKEELANNGDSEDQEQRRYALKCHNKIPQEAFRHELC